MLSKQLEKDHPRRIFPTTVLRVAPYLNAQKKQKKKNSTN